MILPQISRPTSDPGSASRTVSTAPVFNADVLDSSTGAVVQEQVSQKRGCKHFGMTYDMRTFECAETAALRIATRLFIAVL